MAEDAGRVRRGVEFFAETLVGQTIAELVNEGGLVIMRLESGLRAKFKTVYRTDIRGEKIAGFEVQFPKNLNVVTLLFASGGRAVAEI